MSVVNLGVLRSGRRDDDNGHRTYEIDWLIESNDVDDGPSVVSTAAGLAAVGDPWTYGNDNDQWAFCTPRAMFTEILGKERGEWIGLWIVRQTFTTRPITRCNTNTIEDPLAEPPQLSGTFKRIQREATRDMSGDLLLMSSLELMRGLNEDVSTPTVVVTKNVATLPLTLVKLLRSHVNESVMWGLPERHVKFVEFNWTRNLYGTCSYYYTITLGFEINFEGYTIPVPDRGSRVLVTDGTAGDPADYITNRDKKTGDPITVFLDGVGNAVEDLSSTKIWEVKIEKEADLFLLGVPTSL